MGYCVPVWGRLETVLVGGSVATPPNILPLPMTVVVCWEVWRIFPTGEKLLF